MYEHRILTCRDCSSPFDFSVREQSFYAEKGFEHEPQRCRECRTVRKTQRANGVGAPPAANGLRPMVEVVCAQCETPTTVPFRPRGDRPVYCRTCFTSMNAVRA